MASAKKTSARKKRKPTPKPPKPGTPADVNVACWEDDPGDPDSQPPLIPINVPVPDQSAGSLPFKISGAAPAPKIYRPGTPEFLYYAAAAALRRTSDFWAPLLPKGTTWQVGKTLPVDLDSGVDLNAFYTRGEGGDTPGLHFFHDNVDGRDYFSGESPDVACHEMGHAVLDAIRPQLFDAQTIEAAAFHESMGDMSAMLSALQVPSFRQSLINDTGGFLNRSSRLSRLAEQLGAAIRVQHPDAVDPDCLRNAANSFFYTDPQNLPPVAPASQLSSEPHAFSRVFSAAFLDALAGIFKLQSSSPGSDELLQASQDIARILVGGILDAPVAPDYYSQVAAHMVAFGENAPFNGKYRDALKSSFVRRGILSLQAAATLTATVTKKAKVMAAAAPAGRPTGELPLASIAAAAFGLKQGTLKVYTAEEPKRFGVTSASTSLGAMQPRSAQVAAEAYTEDLFQRGHVEIGPHSDREVGLVHRFAFKTHQVVEKQGDLILKRISFDCGFDHRGRWA